LLDPRSPRRVSSRRYRPPSSAAGPRNSHRGAAPSRKTSRRLAPEARLGPALPLPQRRNRQRSLTWRRAAAPWERRAEPAAGAVGPGRRGPGAATARPPALLPPPAGRLCLPRRRSLRPLRCGCRQAGGEGRGKGGGREGRAGREGGGGGREGGDSPPAPTAQRGAAPHPPRGDAVCPSPGLILALSPLALRGRRGGGGEGARGEARSPPGAPSG
ncbi:unnamed protein product, partial [Bubo scandiacus]